MRLDLFLVQKNLANSRTQAQDFIANGFVYLLQGKKKVALKKSNYIVAKAEQDKIEAVLAKQQALLDERYAADAVALKKLEEELAQTKTAGLKKFTDRSSYPNNNTATLPIDIRTVNEVQPLAVDALQIISNKNEHLAALLIKYKNGVTEEILIGKNLIIIQRVVVRDAMAWVYQKKIFNWGGVAFFRDGVAITEGIFEMETKTA